MLDKQMEYTVKAHAFQKVLSARYTASELKFTDFFHSFVIADFGFTVKHRNDKYSVQFSENTWICRSRFGTYTLLNENTDDILNDIIEHFEAADLVYVEKGLI